MQRPLGAIGRIKGLVGELNGYLHRRRLRRSPLIRLYWPNGAVRSLELESAQAKSLMAVADELIALSAADLEQSEAQ